MASLYRKKARGKTLSTWYCFFRITLPDGTQKQIHRSTRKTSKTEAMKAALKLEEASTAAAGVDDKTQSAIMAKLSEAAEMAFKNKLNSASAKMILNSILTITGQTPIIEYTLKTWSDEWLSKKIKTTKESTAAFYKGTIKQFVQFCDEKADMLIDVITDKDIEKYLDSILASGRTAKTANHKRKVLRSLFGDAMKSSHIVQNPAALITHIDENDSIPRVPFTQDETAKLIASAPSEEWRGIMIIGAFTGLRLRDIAQLKAGNVNLEKRKIKVVPMKTDKKKKVVEIPMHNDVMAFFKTYKLPAFSGANLFPTLHAKPAGGSGGLSTAFISHMKTLGIARYITEDTEDGAGKIVSQKSFHSLRHTFTSWLANADIPAEIRMLMTGHTDTDVHSNYTHHEFDILKKAVDKLDGINSKKKKAQG